MRCPGHISPEGKQGAARGKGIINAWLRVRYEPQHNINFPHARDRMAAACASGQTYVLDNSDSSTWRAQLNFNACCLERRTYFI